MGERLKKSGNFKERVVRWTLFCAGMFIFLTLLDVFNGRKVSWGENVYLPLFIIIGTSFFNWAWDSKTYGKESE